MRLPIPPRPHGFKVARNNEGADRISSPFRLPISPHALLAPVFPLSPADSAGWNRFQRFHRILIHAAASVSSGAATFAGEASLLRGETSGRGAMSECRIKSFRASWSAWNISWPLTNSSWSSSTIQLPVKFRLELEPGSSKSDCVVGQRKRGQSAIGGNAGSDIWPDWVGDSEWGSGWWWSGDTFAGAGKGEWESANVANFEDAPGFYKAGAGQSLYMGAAAGRTGYFDFKTFVKDKATDKTLAEINWSMRIDVPTPGKGGFWWSFSDQK